MNSRLSEIIESGVFVDTNILFYGVNADRSEKSLEAGELLASLWQKIRLPSISMQVLQEFYVTLIKNKIETSEAQRIVKDYYVWNVIPVSTHLIDDAFQIQRRYLLSFWDSLIVSAAQLAQCAHILTEDLNHGQRYGRVMAINPFHRSLSYHD
ncbi:MAG: hypothetical protein LDLANPLL_02853 [Turneriella sp.]|nr:hypothetical protein [Turneriella sp.]